MTTNELRESGYKHYPCPPGKNADDLFQKTIHTPCGEKAYFVNFYLYREIALPGSVGMPESFMAEIALYPDAKSARWITLQVHQADSIAEVEEFADKVYRCLGCLPDIHNN